MLSHFVKRRVEHWWERIETKKVYHHGSEYFPMNSLMFLEKDLNLGTSTWNVSLTKQARSEKL